MPGNPLVVQGTLNRIRGTVTWPNFPQLNVTAPYLGAEGIRLALEGNATQYIKTLTGSVTSPEVYMDISCHINLLKTQFLATLYKTQMELLSTIGDGLVTPDTSVLTPYPITNCSIQNVRELSFNGTDAGWVVTIGGYYLINSSLFNL